MASYTVARAKHATLVASTVDTVTVGAAWDDAEVYNGGTTDLIYFTADGTTPTVAGDDCLVVGPGQALQTPTTGPVKLISAGTPPYHVTGL